MIFAVSMADFFQFFWSKILVILITCVPFFEVKGAIPFGYGMGIPLPELLLLTQAGSVILTTALLLLLRPLFKWMKTTKLLRWIAESFEKRAHKKTRKMQDKMENSKTRTKRMIAMISGLFLFVAIPLPGTGVWTGCTIATVLDIRFKYAFPTVVLGNLVATLIMCAFSTVFFKIAL